MTIAEIERILRGVIDGRTPDEHGRRVLRAACHLLPVVRAALDWHRVNTGQHTNGPQHALAQRDTRRALVDAVDSMRRDLGSK